MKHKIVSCDCCMKENIEKTLKVKLPVIGHEKGKPVLTAYKMDLCKECANRIANCYYEIANEHGCSGYHAFFVDQQGVNE